MSHLQIAKNVLRFESEQMLKTMEKLDDTFDDAVQAILAAKGKIVVSALPELMAMVGNTQHTAYVGWQPMQDMRGETRIERAS